MHQRLGAGVARLALVLGAIMALTGVLTSAVVGRIEADGARAMALVIAGCAAVSLAAYLLLVRQERSFA